MRVYGSMIFQIKRLVIYVWLAMFGQNRPDHLVGILVPRKRKEGKRKGGGEVMQGRGASGRRRCRKGALDEAKRTEPKAQTAQRRTTIPGARVKGRKKKGGKKGRRRKESYFRGVLTP